MWRGFLGFPNNSVLRLEWHGARAVAGGAAPEFGGGIISDAKIFTRSDSTGICGVNNNKLCERHF